MKLAAIDIGSNSSKLLISNVFEVGEWTPIIRKADLYRIPLRLGEDAFTAGTISREKSEDLLRTIEAFRNIMTVCRVEDHMACATSALRIAGNGPRIVEDIRRRTGIDIHLFDGAQSAEVIALNRLTHRFNAGAYLYIDVGGGSTDLTLHADGKLVASRSFNVGLVRLKKGLVPNKEWERMKIWVRNNTVGMRPLYGVGSGGNINKIFKLTRKHPEKPLSLKKLEELHTALEYLSCEERMIQLGLRPDRADVIVEACHIFMSVMKWAGADRIYVPQIGLADGLIQFIYRKNRMDEQEERSGPSPTGLSGGAGAASAPME